jgi:hypothetical protein
MQRFRDVQLQGLQQAKHSKSNWHFPPHDEAELVALACVCRLQQQQREQLQVEPNLTADGVEDDEEDDELEAATDVGRALTGSGKEKLKSRFLDRLAELIAREKRSSFVTCTSLAEREDSITIIIARNTTWDQKDRVFLGHLANFWEALASKGL